MNLSRTHSGPEAGCFFLFLFVFLFTTHLAAQDLGGGTRYAGPSESGTLLVDAAGYGKSKTAAFDKALEQAFRTLLLQGIAGSYQYRPLLGSEAHTVYGKHEAFFQTFFAEKQHLNFVIEQEAGPFKRRAKKTNPNLTVRVLLRVTALREYLEQEGVIRKFGF